MHPATQSIPHQSSLTVCTQWLLAPSPFPVSCGAAPSVEKLWNAQEWSLFCNHILHFIHGSQRASHTNLHYPLVIQEILSSVQKGRTDTQRMMGTNPVSADKSKADGNRKQVTWLSITHSKYRIILKYKFCHMNLKPLFIALPHWDGSLVENWPLFRMTVTTH